MRSRPRFIWLLVPVVLALAGCGDPSSAGDEANPYLAGPQAWTQLRGAALPAVPSGSVFVSDLDPLSAKSGWGPIEKDRSNGGSKAGDGRPLTLGKVVYPKGLGVHANAKVVYHLGGACSAFQAKVGLDDEIRARKPRGSVVFKVLADGREVYTSSVMRGGDPAKSVDADLRGAQQLQLVVTDAGDNIWYDHADWADARLTCAAPTGAGAGTGLTGQYFATPDLSGPATLRTDPTVNFDWAEGRPLAGVGADNFSVRWNGYVVPLYGETYTFTASTDDGVRLWVNGQLLIDHWAAKAVSPDSGQITLEAGKMYALKLEYFEQAGLASAKLEWHSDRQARQVVPQSQLFPVPPPPAACAGVAVTPADDLRALAAARPEGTRFCLAPGLYREVSVIPRAGQSFIGEPGTVLSGARVLSGWVPDGAAWRVGGQPQQGQVHANGACQAGHPRCGYPEQLFIDDQVLLHVASRADVRPGTWFFDYDADSIYLGSDPADHLVETSVTRTAFAGPMNGSAEASPAVPGVLLEGLTIEKYATPAQMGAVGDQFPSPDWTVRRCEVRLNHGVGILLGAGSKALGNHVHHNGHGGIGGGGHQGPSGVVLAENILVQDNEIDHNNTAGFVYDWEGGAGKFGYTRNLVYRHNAVHHNFGMGAWTDTDNVGALIENNTVESNDGVGIMHEISSDAIIRDNVVRDNGLKGNYVYSAGILISSSSNVEVSGNTVEVGATSGGQAAPPITRMGIVVHQGDAGVGSFGPRVSQHNRVHDNTITYLAREQVLDAGAGISRTGILSNGNSEGLLDNSFEHNTYVMPDCTQPRWNWVTPGPQNGGTGTGHAETFAGFQNAGFERTGTCQSR